VIGKGGEERYVPFGQKVAKALLKYKLKHRREVTITGHGQNNEVGERSAARVSFYPLGIPGYGAGNSDSRSNSSWCCDDSCGPKACNRDNPRSLAATDQ